MSKMLMPSLRSLKLEEGGTKREKDGYKFCIDDGKKTNNYQPSATLLVLRTTLKSGN